MGRRIVIAVTIVTLSLIGGRVSIAEDDAQAPIVVELYTSQGCPSCPPADAEFSRLADRGDLVALALHVDYWDYLGWKDAFGSPVNTERQRAYAKAMGERMIYTPQMVVQGREHTIGSQRELIDAAIRRQSENPRLADLDLVLDDGRLQVSVAPLSGPPPEDAHISLAYFRSHERVEIGAGENSGLVVEYRNVVTEWAQLGEWEGNGVTFTAPDRADSDGVAVIVQVGAAGPIVAARQFALP